MRYLPNFRSSSFDVRPAIYDCDFTKLYTFDDLANKGWTYGRLGIGSYVDDNGIVVYNRHNLCLQSQNFTVSWTGNQATATYPVSGQTAPDGTATVNRFNENTNLGSAHSLSSSNAGVASLRDYVCTFSAYLKEDTNSSPVRPTGILQFSAGSVSRIAVAFDIRNGFGTVLEASTLAGTQYTNYGINDAGNGWYRCWVQMQVSYLAATNLLQGFFATSTSAAGVAPGLTNGVLRTYNGAGASAGFFCWGAQIEVNPGMRGYIPTTTSAVHWPRLSETKGLLLEVGSTNLLPWSETFSTTGGTNVWIYSGITSSLGSTSPNNGTNAIRFKHDGSTTGSATIGVSNAAGSVANRSFSIWAKQIGTAGTAWYSYNYGITQDPFIGITNTWQRYEFVYTNQNHRIMLGICGANQEFEFWGAQLETAGWPTSYISNANTNVARATDACSLLSPNSSFINSDAGSLFADYSVNSASPGGGLVTTSVKLGKGNCAAYYALGEFTVGGGFPVGSHQTISYFTTLSSKSTRTSTWLSGEFRKAAFNYIAGTCLAGFISGLTGFAPAPNASITGMNKIDLCSGRQTTIPVPVGRENSSQCAWIKRIKYWNSYLAIEDLRRITGAS